jgi:nucleotide-binding universal stress UspA family protein
MYRRLLVPITEPSEVEPLLRFGASLLDADGEIRMLHIIQHSSLPDITKGWRSSVNLVIPAHEAGAALDVRVEPEVRASTDVPGEILDSVESHGIDAILMTLRGTRGSRNPFVGHTASGILHHATCDVLILNRLALAHEKTPRILLPTFSTSPPAKALRLAEELSVRGQGIPILTLQLSARDDEEGSPKEGLSPRGIPLVRRQRFFSSALLGRRHRLPELILGLAAKERYGFLIVGDEGARPEAPLLTRSFLEELFRGAPCPVMAVRG